jgi:glycosyltransferase involved in cell wall biosynthesis
MQVSTKKKVLFIQPSLQPPGGGNMVGSWMLEALKEEYDITLLTWAAVDFASVNRYYGTTLQATDVTVRTVPWYIRFLIELIPDSSQFQRYVALMRWGKSIKHRYAVVITACDETDYGCKGIQYIHYPYLKRHWEREPRPDHDAPWYQYAAAWVTTRLRPWRLISGFSFQRMAQNLTLSNSDWTARQFQKVYGTAAIVLYPPVPGDCPAVPWAQRDNGFVCIGRIFKEKRYEEIIDILAAVKPYFPELRLHIIGAHAGDFAAEYEMRVRKKVQANTAWVFLHEDLSRQQLLALASRHRYGIHGMRDEHFGIAVADLVRSGCIPFVPDSGGQVEIVGHDQRLLYHTPAEAVEKILRVMRAPHEQQALQTHLAARKELFTAEKFMRHMQEIVQNFLHDTAI